MWSINRPVEEKYLNSIMHRTVLLALILSGNLSQAQPRFEAQVIDANISIGYGLATGDVDGDKKPDILLADKKQIVWYRNPDWKKFVLAENLTAADNVCIAARDIDDDGMAEIAVGAQWNPGETSDTLKSGSVHYLVRPKDPTQKWTAVKLHHEPTVHRMKWVMVGPHDFRLVVVPLHGRGNANGAGTPVKVLAYRPPQNATREWTIETIDQSMHLTHNLDVIRQGNKEVIAIGGKEGVKMFSLDKNKWTLQSRKAKDRQIGEIRFGAGSYACIEPMHGNKLTYYSQLRQDQRTVLDSTLNQGHALAMGDVMNVRNGQDQIIVGWREPDKNGQTGIRIFIASKTGWTSHWIDEGGMACEDLTIADLNNDSIPEIIASGRASKNVKVYWYKGR
jgi:hypothetical protein